MPVFRVLNQAPAYLLPSGQVNAGGWLFFYETNLTTLKNTWSDPAKTVLNSNPVQMDAAGRTVTDVWGDGEYGVVMTEANPAVVVWTRNHVRADAGDGTTLPDPAGQAGKFIVSDGSNYVLQSFYLLPDPTGLNNYMLVSDGDGYVLQQQPEAPSAANPEIVVTANSFQAGVSTNTSKNLEQTGTGAAAGGGSKTATASVVFAVPFSSAPTHVSITPTTTSACNTANLIPSWAVTAISTTGFTVTFSTITGGTSSDAYPGSNITGSQTFTYKATGIKVVP